MRTQNMPQSLFDRFWRYVDDSGSSDACWLWTGGSKVGQMGYGGLVIRRADGTKTSIGAHRLSWILHHASDIPKGLSVLHLCDVPLCVNPRHLSLGTSTDNNRDTHRKGRAARPPMTKLTPRAVWVIRHMLSFGVRPARLARMYDVAPETIQNIKRGSHWKGVAL